MRFSGLVFEPRRGRVGDAVRNTVGRPPMRPIRGRLGSALLPLWMVAAEQANDAQNHANHARVRRKDKNLASNSKRAAAPRPRWTLRTDERVSRAVTRPNYT
jgi:hypothetical protein